MAFFIEYADPRKPNEILELGGWRSREGGARGRGADRFSLHVKNGNGETIEVELSRDCMELLALRLQQELERVR